MTIPSGLRNARLQPPRAAVAALLLVLLAAAVILGARVAVARAVATPQPVSASHFGGGGAHAPVAGLVSRSVPSAFGTGAAALPSPSPPTQPTSTSLLWVDVVGQVRRAGVVRLPPGARVLDAVNAAGGALRGADLASVNLARPVADGEQIVVPSPGEVPRGLGMPGSAPGSGAGSLGTAGAGSGAAGAVDLNAADATALDTLPGVGPVLAQRILDWRAEHGRFTSVDELGEVSGIGDKLLAQLRPRVRV